ncbi:hypothetical protein IJI55_01710 [Candidatus Saccharibacteria bacterium]|nr:hypothetical protein [Candidatus Saccharibacteria bacterium]MBR3323834.1 hypothetical protein [Candidatus Saccharibacteria bacterium]
MAKSDKKSLSRKYLKVLGVVMLIFGVLGAIVSILAMFAINSVDLSQMFNASQLESFRNANISDDLIRIMVGVTAIIASLLSVLEGWLLMRASNDPKKSTFLLVLLVLSVISGIYNIAVGGIQNIGANISGILSLTLNVLAVMAVMSARKEAE